jgi:hypothetical protein
MIGDLGGRRRDQALGIDHDPVARDVSGFGVQVFMLLFSSSVRTRKSDYISEQPTTVNPRREAASFWEER